MTRVGMLGSDKAKVRQAEAWLLSVAHGVSRSDYSRWMGSPLVFSLRSLPSR